MNIQLSISIYVIIFKKKGSEGLHKAQNTHMYSLEYSAIIVK